MEFPTDIWNEIISYTGTSIEFNPHFVVGRVYFCVPLDKVHNQGYNVEVVRFKVVSRTPKTLKVRFLKTTDKMSFDHVGIHKKMIKTANIDGNDVETIRIECQEYSHIVGANNDVLTKFHTKENYRSFMVMYTFEGIVMRHLESLSRYSARHLLRLWLTLTDYGVTSGRHKWVNFYKNNCKIMYEAITDKKIDDCFSNHEEVRSIDIHGIQLLYVKFVVPHLR